MLPSGGLIEWRLWSRDARTDCALPRPAGETRRLTSYHG